MTNALEGFAPVYWINLDQHVERRARCSEEFDKYGVANTRLAGVDGIAGDLADYLEGERHPRLTTGEIGCYLSHLRAIDYFLQHSDQAYAVICEDDLSLELSEYWSFTFSDILNRAPRDCEILQLAVTTGEQACELPVSVHPHTLFEWGTACYVIRRSYAARLVEKFKVGDRFKLDWSFAPKPVADLVLYAHGQSYTFPCLSYTINDEPDAINQHHYSMHKVSDQMICWFWKEFAHRVPPARFWDAEHKLLVRPDTRDIA